MANVVTWQAVVGWYFIIGLPVILLVFFKPRTMWDIQREGLFVVVTALVVSWIFWLPLFVYFKVLR